MSSSIVTYRLVGPGRAGRSLIQALSATSWDCRGVHRHDDDPDDLTHVASDVDAVIVAVPDDAISTVAEAIEPGSAVLIHLSGAKTLDVLLPHDNRGSVHPLASLPDPETGAQRLQSGITFAVAGHPLAAELVKSLNGKAINVADDQRALYHTAAVVAANHLVALYGQVERICAHVDLPPSLYHDLMQSTLDNAKKVGAQRALTGPAARGDLATLDAHLNALAELGPFDVELYKMLAESAGRLAGREQLFPTTSDRSAPRT